MSKELRFKDLQIGEHFTGNMEGVGMVVCTKLTASKGSYSFPPDIVCTFTLGKAGKTQWPIKRYDCRIQDTAAAPPKDID